MTPVWKVSVFKRNPNQWILRSHNFGWDMTLLCQAFVNKIGYERIPEPWIYLRLPLMNRGKAWERVVLLLKICSFEMFWLDILHFSVFQVPSIQVVYVNRNGHDVIIYWYFLKKPGRLPWLRISVELCWSNLNRHQLTAFGWIQSGKDMR